MQNQSRTSFSVKRERENQLLLTVFSMHKPFSFKSRRYLCVLKFSHTGSQVRTNSLSGVIPSELGRLTNLLHELHLGTNQLQGAIPSQLGQLSLLEDHVAVQPKVGQHMKEVPEEEGEEKEIEEEGDEGEKEEEGEEEGEDE